MSESVYRWEGPPSIDLQREQVTLPSGRSYLAHKLVTADGRRGVVIVARRGPDVLLVRAHRPAIDATVWELPRGFGTADPADPAGSVADGARELREESGYTAVSPEDVGGYITDTSVLPTEVRVIRCTVERGELAADTDDEASDTRWVAWTAIPSLIADGTLADAHTLAALAIAGARDGGYTGS